MEGNQTRAAVSDFERCLQLGGTGLRDDLSQRWSLSWCTTSPADLRRVVGVLRSLRDGLQQGRQWLRPVIEASFGVVSWLRGEFNAANSHLEHAIPI